MTLEEIQAQLDELVAQERAPTPPDGRGLGDRVMGGAAAGLSGLNQGLAQGVALPMDLAGGVSNYAVDPINSLLEALGSQTQIPRYEQGAAADLVSALMDAPGEAMGVAGATQYEPQSAAERTIQNVGQDTGLGLGTLAPVAAAAGPLAAGGGMVGRGIASMVDGLAARPAAFLGAETLAGISSGAGGEAARARWGDDYESLGELVGAFGGAGALVAARPAAMTAAHATEAAMPGIPGVSGIVERDVNRRAAAQLQGAALDPAAAAQNIEAHIPGERLPAAYQPRTAQLAGDMGIDQVDRAMLNRNPRAQERNRFNREVLGDAAGANVPTRDLDELATGIRGSLDSNLEQFRARSAELFDPQRIDPSGSVRIAAPEGGTQPLQDAASRYGSLAAEEQWDVSGPIRAIADAMAMPEQTYAGVINLRQRLNRLARNVGARGSLNDMDAINVLRDGIEEALGDMAEDAPRFWAAEGVEDGPEYLYGSLGRYREANNFYRQNVEAYTGDIPSTIFGPDAREAENTMARALARGTDGIAATRRAAVDPRTEEPDGQTLADVMEYLMGEQQQAMLTGADQGRVGASALRRHLNRRGAVIRQVFGDEHLRTLQDISEALGDIDAPFLRSQGTPNSATAQNIEAQRARQMVSRAVSGVLQDLPGRGLVSGALNLGEGIVQSQAIRNQRAVDALVDRALIDPEMAAELLRMTTGPSQAGSRVVEFLTQWVNQELRSAGAEDPENPRRGLSLTIR